MGVGCADFDGDGDVDLVVQRSNEPTLVVENRGTPKNSWVEVALSDGTARNRFGVGARVEVKVRWPDGTAQRFVHRSTATIAIENSLQFWTVGFAMAGFDTQSIVSGKGGTLLVQSFLFLPFLLPPEGATLAFDVPYDEALFGMHAYVQALELDDGASRRVSFTPGLDLGFGQ